MLYWPHVGNSCVIAAWSVTRYKILIYNITRSSAEQFLRGPNLHNVLENFFLEGLCPSSDKTPLILQTSSQVIITLTSLHIIKCTHTHTIKSTSVSCQYNLLRAFGASISSSVKRWGGFFMLIALTRFQMISLKDKKSRIRRERRQTQSSRLFPKIPHQYSFHRGQQKVCEFLKY